jgi:hypothetical protein
VQKPQALRERDCVSDRRGECAKAMRRKAHAHAHARTHAAHLQCAARFGRQMWHAVQ